jgi:hypothetical protein
MKRACLSLTLAALALPAFAATNVGVSIGIDQPGMYGRIDIGRVMAPPLLMYPQPVLVVAPPVHVVQQPIYLRVPPGHARHWRNHCGAYNACGQPVYFVQEGWYRQHYEGRHGQEGHRGHNGHGHD